MAGHLTAFASDLVHHEDLLDPLDLILGLGQVVLEGLLELGVTDLLDHLRQRLGDLLLGVIDVLQGMDEEIVQGLDRLGKQTHLLHSLDIETIAGACGRGEQFVSGVHGR